MGRLRRSEAGQGGIAQLVVGLAALPLSVLPFVAYGTLTPEGRLVRDRAVVRISPPALPTLSRAQRAAAAARGPRYQGGVMVLAYHGIGSSSDGEGGFVISPQRFGEHLATLRAAGMRTVTAAEVARAFAENRPLPPNAVMISFDDGRTDAMLFADPLLRQARMAATMFVITGAASSPGVYYAPWSRIEGYARSGRWDIESHTSDSHHQVKTPDGRLLPALTSLKQGESLAAYRARIRSDLARASAAIEAHTGRRPVAFAYPFGAYGADRSNDPAIRDILREEVARQYSLAFHQDEQAAIPLATTAQDRLGLRRLEVGPWSGTQLLQRISAAAVRSGLSVPTIPGPDLERSAADAGVLPNGQVRPDGSLLLPYQEMGDTGGRPSRPSSVPEPSVTATPGPIVAAGMPLGTASAPSSSPSTSSGGASSAPPATVARPPVTSPPVTSRPVTSPPVTSPPATSPPATAAPLPGCTNSGAGQGPKKCSGSTG